MAIVVPRQYWQLAPGDCIIARNGYPSMVYDIRAVTPSALPDIGYTLTILTDFGWSTDVNPYGVVPVIVHSDGELVANAITNLVNAGFTIIEAREVPS